MAMWSLTTHQAGKCIWPGATRATAIIHVVTSRCHLPVTLGMNWISRGATSHQLDRKCPIISHIFSSIVTLIIDCLRTGWSQLPPQAAEQAENVRQRYGKDKTEGLNALHMNTQNATRCIALIKIKHFHRPLNFKVVERVSASW